MPDSGGDTAVTPPVDGWYAVHPATAECVLVMPSERLIEAERERDRLLAAVRQEMLDMGVPAEVADEILMEATSEGKDAATAAYKAECDRLREALTAITNIVYLGNATVGVSAIEKARAIAQEALDADGERRELLNEQACRIDARPPDGSTRRVHVDAEMSTTSAVTARGLLDKAIADLDEQQGGGRAALWVTWPLRVVACALEDAVNAEQCSARLGGTDA